MARLDGKVAVITGGNSGIGLATATRFAAEGAQVVVTGRRAKELDEAVAAIGGGAVGVPGDVSRLDDLDRLFETVRERHGRIDVLVANAGAAALEPLGHITEGSFDAIVGTNFKGTVFTVQKALPLLRPGASVILVGSTTGSMGSPAFSVYGATKAAIRNLARNWALDLKGTGVRVNVLSPGPTATPGFSDIARLAGGEDAMRAAMTAQVPLGRIAEPADIAAVALFLASDDSASMTGSEVSADGGFAQV